MHSCYLMAAKIILYLIQHSSHKHLMDCFFIWHSSLPRNLGNLFTGRVCKTLFKSSKQWNPDLPQLELCMNREVRRHKVNCIKCVTPMGCNPVIQITAVFTLPKMWNPWELWSWVKIPHHQSPTSLFKLWSCLFN